MTVTTTVEVQYVHRYEYRTRNAAGEWSEPQIRYHNPTVDLRAARRRHEECRDVEYEWAREFEGTWGYSWKNCQLVRRETKTEVTEAVI